MEKTILSKWHPKYVKLKMVDATKKNVTIIPEVDVKYIFILMIKPALQSWKYRDTDIHHKGK